MNFICFHKKFILSAVFFVVFLCLSSCSEDGSELGKQETSISINQPQVKGLTQNNKNVSKQKKQPCQNLNIKFFQTNNDGNDDAKGSNYVIIFDPKSKELDFKVDDVLEGISKNYCLGNIQEGMLFDGGFSTGLYFDNKIYVENTNPIGSVFLIYKTE